jgi:hypothetical protein
MEKVFQMIMQRDCPDCIKLLDGSAFPAQHTRQDRIYPNGKWHHTTRAGRALHQLATNASEE